MYDDLIKVSRQLDNILYDNNILTTQLQAIKEELEKESNKNKSLVRNDYNTGMIDELEYIKSRIFKIIGNR